MSKDSQTQVPQRDVAKRIAAWVFALEHPLTSETDLRVAEGIIRRMLEERRADAPERPADELRFWLCRINAYRDATGLPLRLQAYCMRSEAKVALGLERVTAWAIELAEILNNTDNEPFKQHCLAELGQLNDEQIPTVPTEAERARRELKRC